MKIIGNNVKRMCWISAFLTPLPFIVMLLPDAWAEIVNPKNTYPYFPYVIFDVLFNLCSLVFCVAAPFFGLIIHYNRRCGDSNSPTVETRIAIAVSCVVSVFTTVGITLFWMRRWDPFDPFMAMLLFYFTVPIMVATCLLVWITARITNKIRSRTK